MSADSSDLSRDHAEAMLEEAAAAKPWEFQNESKDRCTCGYAHYYPARCNCGYIRRAWLKRGQRR